MSRRTPSLRAIVYMSSGQLEKYLDEMHRFDLVVRRDIAIGEMAHGEWRNCPGIRFENRGGGFSGSRIAIHDPS
jgi:hypothetical protein